MSDFEEDYDDECPKCGHSPTRYRDCSGLFCDEGYVDESESDPINFMPGESEVMCQDCFGRGIEEWCSKCGADISKLKMLSELFPDGKNAVIDPGHLDK